MPTVEVLRPGSSSENPEYPNEIYWGFTVMVDGQAYVDGGYFARGTSEGAAAAAIHSAIMAGTHTPGGITSTGGGPSGGGGGSGSGGGSSTAGSGVGGGPIAPDRKDRDDIPKMKTEDGT